MKLLHLLRTFLLFGNNVNHVNNHGDVIFKSTHSPLIACFSESEVEGNTYIIYNYSSDHIALSHKVALQCK